MIRLDLGLALLQGLKMMGEHHTRLEGISTILELLRHPHHTDHLVTIIVFPVATLEVNPLEDRMGEVEMVVVDQTEGLMGILGLGQEDQHLHQETLVLDLEGHHILWETLAVDPDLLLLQVGG